MADVAETHDDDDAADQARRRVAAAADAHGRALLAYAAHLLGSAEPARDVVQEAFARLCAQPASARVRLPEWLFAVCRNLAIDRLRRERTRRREQRMSAIDPHVLDRAAADERAAASPALRLMRDDESRRLADLLSTLPPRQQEAVRLKFQQELSYAQIAAAMGTTANNVAVLVHLGLKTLRERMGAS